MEIQVQDLIPGMHFKLLLDGRPCRYPELDDGSIREVSSIESDRVHYYKFDFDGRKVLMWEAVDRLSEFTIIAT